jgi:hypothetical protein
VRGSLRLLLLGLAAVGGCAGAAPGSSTAAGTLAARGIPTDQNERLASLDRLGAELHGALRRGDLGELWADGNDLDLLLTVEARARRSAGRRDSGQALSRGGWATAWAGHPYGGFCAQGARLESAGGALGLREPGWIIDRMLVVSADGHRQSASWVDGLFVYTTRGWLVIELQEAEAPRPGHADLELAPCDVQRGLP